MSPLRKAGSRCEEAGSEINLVYSGNLHQAAVAQQGRHAESNPNIVCSDSFDPVQADLFFLRFSMLNMIRDGFYKNVIRIKSYPNVYHLNVSEVSLS